LWLKAILAFAAPSQWRPPTYLRFSFHIGGPIVFVRFAKKAVPAFYILKEAAARLYTANLLPATFPNPDGLSSSDEL
jgi:hypothetical protein